jgi:hypothetical protein
LRGPRYYTHAFAPTILTEQSRRRAFVQLCDQRVTPAAARAIAGRAFGDRAFDAKADGRRTGRILKGLSLRSRRFVNAAEQYRMRQCRKRTRRDLRRSLDPVMPLAGGRIAKFVIPFRQTGDKLASILFPPLFVASFGRHHLNRPRVAFDPSKNQRRTPLRRPPCVRSPALSSVP